MDDTTKNQGETPQKEDVNKIGRKGGQSQGREEEKEEREREEEQKYN